MGEARRSAWSVARQLAEQTPEARNRYVDFLRALSIMAVVFGHWLIAAPRVVEGQMTLGHMLSISPWTQWLTWGFQVMPVFFIVGGYSNSASWSAALRTGSGYAAWLAARLRRLVGPLLPLLIVWAVLGIVGRIAGLSPDTIRVSSQVALVPVWFLAVYVLVAVLVPPTHAAWRRHGFLSFWALAVAAALIDLAAFYAGLGFLRWLNYLFVWLSVHQLGYAWRDDRLAGPRRALPWAIGGAVMLWALLNLARYPRSMVGVPGEEISNTLPPTLAMLGLACLQGGLLLAIEPAARRWLARIRVWTATVLVNSMIMTVYLWHLTVMALCFGAAYLLGGVGLRLEPGSSSWWAARPLWMAVLVVALVPCVALLVRFERAPAPKGEVVGPAWQLILGAVLVCGGLALMALHGVGGGPIGIRGWVLLPLVGAALTGSIRRRRPRVG